MKIRHSIRNGLFLAGALAGSAAFAGTASAAGNSVVACTPERVRATADRMDMRCTGINRWFIAWRSSTGVEQFNNMLGLTNSAVVSGKTLNIYYDLDASSNGILWGVELFK
jgi:hypothetical protein